MLDASFGLSNFRGFPGTRSYLVRYIILLARGIEGGSDIGGLLASNFVNCITGDQVVQDISSFSHVFDQLTLENLPIRFGNVSEYGFAKSRFG